ncbi:DNA polymerase III subunit alpha [Caldibacillus lycopersici]|uniref:DNA polymerase III subunit alpha n=1 Tax=Perspicuibacillus lycopersici TaxID=1325689 RepID=A0AAE3IT97_9BACI|nr:DNA polymerase III subunit alpha [Perspicuibacillus lycopersici]MCU9614195.1 DNA polymerase III subunit alpha [Perspicuibacillus lycopersici]
MSIVHLQTYSAYSLLSSTITPDALVLEAKKRGYDAITLTDRNVLYGVIPFYKACMKHGIKPIIGITADILMEESESPRSFPLVLIAKNKAGYQNLVKISSAIQTKSANGIPLKWLKYYSRHLFAITPGTEGEIEQLMVNDQMEEAKERILFYQKLFDSNSFFLSIQNYHTKQEQQLVEKIIRLSEACNLPIVATNPVYFLDKADYVAWNCLKAIKENINIDSVATNRLEEENYLKSVQEFEALFKDFPQAIKNTEDIAAQTNISFDFHQQLLPKYPLADKNADDFLTELCEKGLKERITSPTSEYYERLAYELQIIQKMKFSDYFLIVWDFTHFARTNGITIGPGRGSAAGSLVAYVLGITDVDPIRYDLLFERFLNPQRVTMPDIDIDFPDHRRDEVIEYVAKKYGTNHVAQIITFGTFAAKAAIRDVARVYGLTSKELEQLSKAIPSRLGITLTSALNESATLKKLVEMEKYQLIFQTAKKIEGLPRHTSTHAAGVIISGQPLVDIVPIQQGSGDVLLTQYPMGILEEIGLLKMDFLGLRNLSLIESILQGIQYQTKKRIRLKDIPINDEKTFELLQAGNTTGVFQLESEGMRNVLLRLKPTEFEDIVAVNALYRPGPMANIPIYINRKHGQEPIVYPHPDLESILKKTYGVIVYQEQIMQIAAKLAGFTLGEADLLRRAVSKKKREVLDEEREHFVQGAIRSGYSQEIANTIYDLIVRFADYGFNRSHAVAYSIISYQLAYLKSHYPLHFMAALLTSVIGNEDKTKEYIKELKQLGYFIYGPSINDSSYRYEVRNDGVRFSLAAIKGVGIQALKEIMRARKERPFADLFDFCLRVSLKVVNRKTMENLIHAGSFDEFGYDRAVLLATLDVAIDHAQLMKPDDAQMDFLLEDGLDIKPKYMMVEPIPIDSKLQLEKQALGMFVSTHPVALYRELFSLHGGLLLEDIAPNVRGSKTGVYLAEERKIRTKNGEAMAFLQISDESADASAVVFPNVYKKYSGILKKGEIVFLTGHMESRNGKEQFVIQDVQSLSVLKEQAGDVRIYLRIDDNHQTNSLLVQLKTIIKKYSGNTPVILYYENQNRTVQLAKDFWVEMDSECISKIKHLLGEENVVIK